MNEHVASSESAQLDPMAEMRTNIRVAPERIEQEFATTTNTWIDCWGTRVVALDMIVQYARRKDLLPTETLEQLQQRVAGLIERLSSLKEQYPTRETNPPEALKQELISELNILEPSQG